MRPIFAFLTLSAALITTGCSIKQTVTPASPAAELPSEICLIPAKDLREGFNTVYTQQLRAKGFQTRQLPSDSPPSACTLSTTYIGTWSWDMALYMSHADIRVFEHGRQIGQAEYDSRSGSGRFDKFIDAETKITELTNQLFPNDVMVTPRKAGATSSQSTAPLSKEVYRQQQVDLLMQKGLSYEEYQKRYHEIMSN